MKTRILLIFICILFASCEDDKKKSEENIDSEAKEYNEIEAKDELGTSAQDQPINQNKEIRVSPGDKEENNEEMNSTFSGLSGKFINTEHSEDSDCSCYCLHIKTNSSSELCLAEDELYINARFSQEQGKINVYYEGKSSKTTNSDLPWDEFDTNVPVATLIPTSNNEFNLDWKGFSINGELAVDYAIYGKKTLEGSYKKL